MAKKQSKQKSLYSVHPSVAYAQAVIGNLGEKTGRSLKQWLGLIKKGRPPEDDKGRRKWLKEEHQLGGTTAMLIADASLGKGSETTDSKAYLKAAKTYVETMYSGKKEGLKPIHDALIVLVQGLFGDVRICPCTTIVPLYRKHVFAEIKPATQKRIDLGFALKGSKKKPTKKLLDTGGLAKGDRITHRIPIESMDQIDSDVEKWLKIAYELDG